MLSFCRLYADDNSIQYADKNINNIECLLNHDLKILGKWFKDWLLQFNPNKLKVLLPKVEDLFCRNEITDHGMGGQMIWLLYPVLYTKHP